MTSPAPDVPSGPAASDPAASGPAAGDGPPASDASSVLDGSSASEGSSVLDGSSASDGSSVLDDLAWRGLIAQTTDIDALRRDLAAGPLTLYCGFDPTADSLHVGNLVPLLALRRFQLAGHRPIALAGGATGFIGDPTGRTAERVMMTPEVVAARVERIRVQLARFLDFDDSPTGALLVDNLEWTSPMSALEWLRDVGRHFSVNQMLAKESVSARLEAGGLSFTEFSYLLLQSYDYLELHRRYGCALQIGGNDQWGNITGGLDLIRRVEGHERSVHALTFPLVTDASGGKIGKSTGGGSVWLDPQLTSPYALYQYLLNVDDRDVGTYLRLLTFLPRERVEELDAATAERPQARAAQRALAESLTALVHGADELARVQAASAALFGGGALEELDESTLSAALAEAPSTTVSGGAVPPLVDLLAAALGVSKSEARRAVRDGGAYLNNRKVTDEAAVAQEGDWLHGRFLVLRRGKRAMAVVERQS